MFRKILSWIVYSSKDPKRLSMTIRGLIGFVPSLVVLLALFNITVQEDEVVKLINDIATFAAGLSASYFTLLGIVGFIRKIWTTARNTNEVILGFSEYTER